MSIDPILRLPEVERVVGYKRSHIRNLETKGAFPRRIALGPRCVGWRTSDIAQWLATRMPKAA